MAALAAAAAGGAANAAPNYNIPGDSVCSMAISFIPVFGAFFSLFKEISINAAIVSEVDPNRIVALLQVKNKYKTINATRELALAALLIAGFATGILGGGVATGIILGVALIAIAAVHLNRRSRNVQLIEQIQSRGTVPLIYRVH